MNQQQRRQMPQVSMKKWAQETSTGGRTAYRVPQGMKLFSRKQPGVINLDFVPYKVGKGNPSAAPGEYYAERTIFLHYNVGPNGAVYCCPARMANERCAICEHRHRINDRDDLSPEEKKAQTKELLPKQRQLWLVIDDADRDAGVQLWEVAFHNFGKELKEKIDNQDEDENLHMFADPSEGHTVKIIAKEETTGSNKYLKFSPDKFRPRRQPLEVHPDDMPCLDDLLIIPTYEQLKKAFFQLDDEDTDDAPRGDRRSAGTAPASGTGNGHSRPPRKEEPEDDDPAPSRQAAPASRAPRRDADEDAPPAPRARQSRPAPVEEPDDDIRSLPRWTEEGQIVYYKDMECEIKRRSRDGTSLRLEGPGPEAEEFLGVSPDECEPHDDYHTRKAREKAAKGGKARATEPEDDPDGLGDEDAPEPPRKSARRGR